MKRNEEYIDIRLSNRPGYRYQVTYESRSGETYVYFTNDSTLADGLQDIRDSENYNTYTNESVYDFIPPFEEWEGSEAMYDDLFFTTLDQMHQRAWDEMKELIMWGSQEDR